MFHFEYNDRGVLSAESVSLLDIAEAVGTPSYVYSEATIRRHFRVLTEAFAPVSPLICYSVKANSNGAVLSLLAGLGSGADIVSAGELFRARRANIPADRIVFSGVGKAKEELHAAVAEDIKAFNVESLGELSALGQVAAATGRVVRVAPRVNPDVDPKTHPYIATGLKESKFGIPGDQMGAFLEGLRAHPGLELVGLDCHIGSQLTSLAPMVEALDALLGMSDALRGQGHSVSHIDLGGGLGIPYSDEQPPHPDEFGEAVCQRLKGRPEHLVLEPGRVIVGNAGILLTRVLYIKETASKRFVVVDAAMNDLMRPALYGAHHEIWPVVQDAARAPTVVDIVGPICESADALARDRTIAMPQPGDLLAVMSAGAYGFTMASTYNSRPRAAEVLVSGRAHAVVRRRESLEEIVALEQPAPWSGREQQG